MDLIIYGAILLVGICIGFAGSHYMVKNSPEKLAKWSKEIKARTGG